MERDETKNNEIGSTVSDHKPYGGGWGGGVGGRGMRLLGDEEFR